MNCTSSNKSFFYRKTLVLYVLLFIAMVPLCFAYFFIQHKAFLFNGDGLIQHLTALSYYGKLLRNYIETLLHGNIAPLPQWDFNLGFGSDIITTLHYYVIGDPLTLLSVFVPEQYTLTLYTALIFLRLFLAGLAFLAYCRFHAYDSLAALVGTICYVFCGFSFYCAVRHPYFINPMIYLPLLCIGVDLILQRRTWLIFAVVVFISAASNFYFFYMLSLLIFVYALIRFFCSFPRSEWRTVPQYVFPCVAAYLLGTVMAAPVFFPQIYGFLFSSRLEEKIFVPLFYKPIYYVKGFLSFIAPPTFGSYSVLGFAAPVLPLMLAVCLQKGRRELQLKLFLAVGTFIFLLPICAHILNGFNYITNRWGFAFSLPVAMSAVHALQLQKNQAKTFKGRKWNIILLLCAVFSILVIVASVINRKVHEEFLLSYVMLAFSIFTFFLMSKTERSLAIPTLVLVLVSSCINANIRYAPWGLDYLKKFFTLYEASSTYKENFLSIADNDTNIFRTETSALANKNSPALSGLHGTTYYWSQNDKILVDMYNELLIPTGSTLNCNGLENDPILSALFNVKYTFLHNSEPVPYGFSSCEDTVSSSQNNLTLFRNNLYVPFGVGYKKAISRSEYLSLPPLEKRAVLLKYAVMPDGITHTLPQYEGEKFSREETFTLLHEENITPEGNRFTVKEPSAHIKLQFQKDADRLYYVYISNLRWIDEPHKGTSLIMTKDGIEKFYEINSAEDATGHSFLLYAGCTDDVLLAFGDEGTFAYDTLSLLSLSASDIESSVTDLRQNCFSASSTSYNTINGKILSDSDTIVCISVPYLSQWSAVEGKTAVKTFPTQSGFIGIMLDAGEHTISMNYRTPLLLPSIVLSILAWGVFLLFLCKQSKLRES